MRAQNFLLEGVLHELYIIYVLFVEHTFLIAAIPMCFHLTILGVSSVKTQLIYCQL
jgi:hypothetical protein